MEVARPNACFVDLTEHVKEPVIANDAGWANSAAAAAGCRSGLSNEGTAAAGSRQAAQERPRTGLYIETRRTA